LPYDEARAREIVGNYENDTMDPTIDSTDEPGLRLEVRMKPEARAAYKEMPLDHAPFDLSLLPGDADGYIITSGARTGQRASSLATRAARSWEPNSLADCTAGYRLHQK